MPEFRVLTPIKLDLELAAINPATTRQAIERTIPQDALDVGCYLFAANSLKRKGKLIPVYVGQTKKSFAAECLAPGTRAKVERYLKSHPKDSLWLFLVAHPRSNGPVNGRAIDEIESFLISRAAEVNPKVENRKGVKSTAWSIRGVIGGGRGRRSDGARRVAQMLELEDGAPPAQPTRSKVEIGE